MDCCPNLAPCTSKHQGEVRRSKHGDPSTQDNELVSTPTAISRDATVANDTQSLHLDRGGSSLPFTSVRADFGQHADITFQDVPRLRYSLRLLVGNEERDVQRGDYQTWTPTKRLYVLSFVAVYTHRNLRM